MGSPVRGGGGPGRGWRGLHGYSRRRAAERPLFAHGHVRGPVPEGRTVASGPRGPNGPHHLLGPSGQGRGTLRQGFHDRRHRPAVRRLDRGDGHRRACPRRWGQRRDVGPRRDLPRLLLGTVDEGDGERREARHRGHRRRRGAGGSPGPDRATRHTGAGRQRGGAFGLEGRAFVSALWVSIVAVTVASAAIRAVGPILAGGREIPPRANAVLALLTPTLLAALVVTGTFGEGGRLTIDEKALGVGVAAVALALRAPMIVAVVLAAVVTALSRLFLG